MAALLAAIGALPVQAETRSCPAALAGPSAQFAAEISDADGRRVPVSVFHPAAPGRYPLVAFSHGAFSSPDRYAAMLAPLAGAGLIVIAPMHLDSEDFRHAAPPPHAATWASRNADMALAFAAQAGIDERLGAAGISADRSRLVAIGHSYGGLIAQLQGGAIAVEPDGSSMDRRNSAVAAVVAWSPPGPLPGLMTAEGWRTMTAPSLTITGTADVLPGFIDNWQAHRVSFDMAPPGDRMLWVGEGVDHYFGGVFGRIKNTDPAVRAWFDRALVTTLAFIERRTGHASPCDSGALLAGEQRVED